MTTRTSVPTDVIGRLAVDPTRCTGFGVCAEILPELVELDEWGYPLLTRPDVPASLRKHARAAVTTCPKLALLVRPPE